MNRPNVRIIDNQKEEYNEIDMNSPEAQEYLRKMGYFDVNYSNNINSQKEESKMSFEEMIEQKRIKEENERQRRMADKPKTFDSENWQFKKKYSEDNDGFGFTINISTDMDLPD